MKKLVNAYLNTDYRVHLPSGWLSLKVGQTVVPTGSFIATQEWLIITACNPASKQLKNTHNFARHCLLSRHLSKAGFSAYPSFAVAGNRQPQWPVEYGCLVVSDRWLPLFLLARRFKQYAVITCRPDDAVHLCIMRAQSSPIKMINHPYIDFV